ncbi:sugar ABC transporter substrate-binding protein [Blastococcus sp. SYSU D00820]
MGRTHLAAGLVGALALALTGCGGDGGSGSSGGGANADVDAARQLIADYVDAPSAFPVSTPLEASPAGKRIAYMDCGTPICGLFYDLAQAPTAELGMELTRIDTGLNADTVATAFDTVVAGDYDGVFVPAIPAQLWESGLDALTDAGIPVVTSGMVGGDADRIPVRQASEVAQQLAGQLLAAYVVAENGDETDVVFYTTPELQLTTVIYEAFEAELAELCDGCAVRSAEIPAASFGTRSSSLVVDDLQAHPSTRTAVFAVGEQAAGLPAALETAGLEVQTIANGPDPATLEQIQNGDMAAALGLDLPVVAWTVVDSLARLVTGQEVDPGAAADQPPMQFLTADNLPDDISHGWTGYPDFPERFGTLWAAAA